MDWKPEDHLLLLYYITLLLLLLTFGNSSSTREKEMRKVRFVFVVSQSRAAAAIDHHNLTCVICD